VRNPATNRAKKPNGSGHQRDSSFSGLAICRRFAVSGRAGYSFATTTRLMMPASTACLIRHFPTILSRRVQKKADVVEYLEVFDHVGLLVNGPPGTAELPFI
jgi:hypothetical protein